MNKLALLIMASMLVGCGTDNLVGTWTRCFEWTAGKGIATLTISQGKISAIYKYFGEYDCNSSNLLFTENEERTWTKGGTSSVSGAHDFDWRYTSMQVTPNSQIKVDYFNAISYCNSSSWVLNETKDCSSGLTGNTWYSIVKIDGTKLYFGISTDGHDGTSADKRFIELSTEAYTKQ